MQISLIAAMTPSGIIGNHNKLPWDIPEELQYFRSQTLGKPVVMGRKTFESIGKLLPKRLNVILTQNKNFSKALANTLQNTTECLVVNSISEVIETLKNHEEIMIMGGATIYQAFLPLATRLYLTTIHQEYAGDVYFPKVNYTEWHLIEEKQYDLFTTRIYQRKNEASINGH